MKNREQLWEDYEEARFALLMDALAEAEGEEALRLSEALNRDPEGALPPEVDRRCEAVIREAFVQRRLHATGRTAVRWLTKVLVAATWWRQRWWRSCSPPPSPSARTCGWPP